MSYIDDVVDVWIRVIETPTEKVTGQKFFVGPGQEHTIEDLARLCHDAAGSAAPIEYVDYRPGEQGQREAFTTEKARRVLVLLIDGLWWRSGSQTLRNVRGLLR